MSQKTVLSSQRLFLQLKDVLDSDPKSRDTMLSQSEFKFDVACKCGWRLQILHAQHFRAYQQTLEHYAKPKAADAKMSKKDRDSKMAHSRYGWYLENGKVVHDLLVTTHV